MNEILSGSERAAWVLGNTGGAAVKMAFRIDTINFSWVDAYLRDKAIRNKIQALQGDIQTALKSPINRDELKSMFTSALAGIESDRLAWFVEYLKAVQTRTEAMVSSNTLRVRNYIPPVSLSKKDVDAIFMGLPEGVKQADIDADVSRLREEIKSLEGVIADELCPPARWIYRDDGKPYSYPQGCRWTQYVLCWEKVVTRFEGQVSVEGNAIKTESEMTAYFALGLDKIGRIPPLRTPLN
ncbi:MAG: hypothetical protein NTY16_06700 [Deltaproteobacteria bacterium]|nr:hypothetical protein [Deltaproteobacteria bacterium]